MNSLTDIQKKYIDLAVIQLKKYDDIAKKLNIDRKTLSIWWNELITSLQYQN